VANMFRFQWWSMLRNALEPYRGGASTGVWWVWRWMTTASSRGVRYEQGKSSCIGQSLFTCRCQISTYSSSKGSLFNATSLYITSPGTLGLPVAGPPLALPQGEHMAPSIALLYNLHCKRPQTPRQGQMTGPWRRLYGRPGASGYASVQCPRS
jgi:hypothetical protein